MTLTNADIGDPAQRDQDDLAPWLRAMVDVVRSETIPTAPLYVPEITLLLATEAVPLWNRIERELKLNRGPPYWAFAWTGGLALARHLLDRPGLVAGRHVLDFGSGSGLTAIAAAKCGAMRVVAHDVDPLAVIAASLNADQNGVDIEVTPVDLLAADSTFDPVSVDVVLVGDMFYERDLAARAMALLERCRAAGCEVLIGDPGRADLPVDRLAKVSTHTIPVTRDCQYVAAPRPEAGEQGFDLRASTVWTFTW
jgi:predicted nicotinamide N-methyase